MKNKPCSRIPIALLILLINSSVSQGQDGTLLSDALNSPEVGSGGAGSPETGDDGPQSTNTSESFTRFSEHLISDDFHYPFGLAAADLDGDGDVDFTTPDVWLKVEPPPTRLVVSTLYWFENDGQENFQRHVVYAEEPGFLERHAIGDINGDGKPDIVIVDNKDNHIFWFTNPGQPSAGPWKKNVITTQQPRAYDVALADFDQDGDLDVAGSGYVTNLITIYENTGENGWDQEWPRFVIGTKISEARTIRTGDFNNDAWIDLLATGAGRANAPDELDPRKHGSSVVWYKNPGKFPSGPETSITCPSCEDSWQEYVIDDRSRAPGHGQPVDINMDGNLDVVMAFGMRQELIPQGRHEVAWFEAVAVSGTDLSGLQWRKHTVGALPFAFEAAAADLDRDGDIDVVATAHDHGDRLVWYENLGDPSGHWKMHLLKENWTAVNQVLILDVNKDGRLGIAATADHGNGSPTRSGGNELRWWRNEGPATANTE